MILSMTGYGKAEGTLGNRKFTFEIKSLNSKQLDISVRMPSMYREKELELRTWLTDRILRGKVDVNIFYEAEGGEKRVSLNRPLMEAYAKDLQEVANNLGQTNPDYISALLRIPEVLRPEREEFNENEWSEIMQLARTASGLFDQYRGQEGSGLYTEFKERIEHILKLERDLTPVLEQRVKRIKERLLTNLEELVDPEKIDRNRYEQEVIYYLEKLDVTEERQRLIANCTYFLEIMDGDGYQGKKLGFITQEIGREINTLGSKANDAEIQRSVVIMKDELEKIKEQVLNVL